MSFVPSCETDLENLENVPLPISGAYQTSRPPAKVRPAPTEQKMILWPGSKRPSSAAQPRAMETLAALVFPYWEIVITNLS